MSAKSYANITLFCISRVIDVGLFWMLFYVIETNKNMKWMFIKVKSCDVTLIIQPMLQIIVVKLAT